MRTVFRRVVFERTDFDRTPTDDTGPETYGRFARTLEASVEALVAIGGVYVGVVEGFKIFRAAFAACLRKSRRKSSAVSGFCKRASRGDASWTGT